MGQIEAKTDGKVYEYLVVINCDPFDLDNVMHRLQNGGCPCRRHIWGVQHLPTSTGSNRASGYVVGMIHASDISLHEFILWLGESYVLPGHQAEILAINE